MLIGIILSFAFSVQPLSRSSLKEFDGAYELLETAKAKNRFDILSKYGPDVLAQYDLIQIQFEPGEKRRDRYDSLQKWIEDARSRLLVLGSLQDLEQQRPSIVAATLAKVERELEAVLDEQQQAKFRQQTLDVASRVFGASCPIDTLFRVKDVLPPRIQQAIGIQGRVNAGLDDAYRDAFNAGPEALVAFEARFPGQKTNEVKGALDFAEADKINGVLRAKTKEGLMKAYMSPGTTGKPKQQLAAALEKILYAEWSGARIHEAEVRAAKDFLAVFKAEPKKSAKYKEIESWLYYNSGEAPSVVVAPPPAGQQQP